MKKMKKLMATMAMASLCIAPLAIQAEGADTYWHEPSGVQVRTGWMNTLPDSTKLSDMSVPGTNDSMTYKEGTGNKLVDANQNQSMPLAQQLNSGIRALNVEVGVRDGYLYLGDKEMILYNNFQDVLATAEGFLKVNPTETIFIHLEEAVDTDEYELIDTLPTLLDKYNIYRGGGINPTMGDMRGKIVILTELKGLGDYAVTPYFVIQDNDHLNDNWDLYDKWLDVKANAERADANASKTTVYMNYLNGGGGSYPYFVASGHVSPNTNAAQLSTGFTEPGFKNKYPDFPRVNRLGVFATIAFEGTNGLLSNYIEKENLEHVGFVMADFPGVEFINEIIEVNSR